MQFSHAPPSYDQINSFETCEAFCNLKLLYECEVNIPGLPHHSFSTPSKLGPLPRRTQTGPTHGYSSHLNPIEQYVFLEPMVSLFSNTKIRLSSLDQRSTDGLAYSYKFKYTLKDMKKKVIVYYLLKVTNYAVRHKPTNSS